MNNDSKKSEKLKEIANRIVNLREKGMTIIFDNKQDKPEDESCVNRGYKGLDRDKPSVKLYKNQSLIEIDRVLYECETVWREWVSYNKTMNDFNTLELLVKEIEFEPKCI